MAGGTQDEATSFDLTALLDILSNIIFFLMASFGAAVVAMVPASVPTISADGANDTADDPEKVTVTMTLAADGAVDISAAHQEIDPSELASFAKRIPGVGGRVDAPALTEHLWTIKEKFRKSQDLVLVPEPKVTYALLVETMDASREKRMVVDGKTVFPQLFPGVVVSSKAR